MNDPQVDRASAHRTGDASGAIPSDQVFDVLRNHRRRDALRYLETVPETTVSDLAEHVAAVENDVAPEEVTSEQRKRVYVALYQNHLPKLADVGAVNYDRNRGTVERTRAADSLSPYLAAEDARDGDDDSRLTPGQVALLAAAGYVAVVAASWLVAPVVADALAIVAAVLVGVWGLSNNDLGGRIG